MAIPTNNATRMASKVIPLDDALKRAYKMPSVELIATNNPHAFISVRMDSTQYPPRRVIDKCGNNDFIQHWVSQLSHLVTTFLKDLPWTWKLDVLRRGFIVDGQYDASVTPIVLCLRMGQDFETTDGGSDGIARGLADLILNN
ncbi:hypothetical protein IFR05_001758 [Cadophora sp. M221]|nr:hypothetical protein IFR05_001758 [Cadophora sp. M221]